MSLTLVGQAPTCLVEPSPRAPSGRPPRALMERPIEPSAVSGFNSHPTGGYSPLPVMLCEQAGMSGDRQSTRGETSTTYPEQQAPWANLFAQGATMTRISRRRWPTVET
jgi:hypothetical protein